MEFILTGENNMRMSMFIANVHRLHQLENYTKTKVLVTGIFTAFVEKELADCAVNISSKDLTQEMPQSIHVGKQR